MLPTLCPESLTGDEIVFPSSLYAPYKELPSINIIFTRELFFLTHFLMDFSQIWVSTSPMYALSIILILA